MSIVLTNDSNYTAIASSIRSKLGVSTTYLPSEMSDAINSIPTGGSDNYFYIENLTNNNGTITFTIIGSLPDLDLKYSTDKTNWTNITFSSTTAIIAIAANSKVYIKNDYNYFSLSGSNYCKITCSVNHSIGGSLNSLINNTDSNGCYPYAFLNLFTNNHELINANNLKLSEYIANHCYYSMFSGCTSLTTAPSLPATILASNCYQNMFTNCASLTTAPQLPATTLADSCYENMFSGCTSLTTAPSLPATILASNCYTYMFSGCTSLATAPSLPATTLADSCYEFMFYGCTSLTTVPELQATELSRYSHRGMFQNCTSLIIAPQLPATTLEASCYYNMFSGCTSLTTVPKLHATTLPYSCYQNMFQGCTSLKVYSTSGEGHDKAWNIPDNGVITGSTRSQTSMFLNVETDNVPVNFPGTSGQQFTYYTQNQPV